MLIPVAMKYFGSEGPVRKEIRMDWTGAATMVIFMVSLMLALSSLAAELAFTPPVAVLHRDFHGLVGNFSSH